MAPPSLPVVDSAELRALVRRCRRLLGDLAEPPVFPGYASLGLSVLTSIYAVRGHPSSVERVVQAYCTAAGIRPLGLGKPGREHGVRALRDAIERVGSERFAAEVVQHRQPTAPRNGILKAEACRLAALALLGSGVGRRADLRSAAKRQAARERWIQVPGQRSGASWVHLLCLSGVNVIEPDAALRALVAAAIGRRVGDADAAALLTAAHAEIELRYPGLEARAFARLLSQHQSRVSALVAPAQDR